LLAEGLEKDLAEMRQAHETYKAEYDAKLEVWPPAMGLVCLASVA
jgi:hypothetical protein